MNEMHELWVAAALHLSAGNSAQECRQTCLMKRLFAPSLICSFARLLVPTGCFYRPGEASSASKKHATKCQEKGLVLGKAKNHFIFSIESVGQIPAGGPGAEGRKGGRAEGEGSLEKDSRCSTGVGMGMRKS